jgi:hypothetical protein
LGVHIFSISRVLLRPKRQVGHKQISGVLIGVRKGERDAKVQKTAQHLLGPENTGAACTAQGAILRVLVTPRSGLDDVAWFSGAEGGSRVDSNNSSECVW